MVCFFIVHSQTLQRMRSKKHCQCLFFCCACVAEFARKTKTFLNHVDSTSFSAGNARFSEKSLSKTNCQPNLCFSLENYAMRAEQQKTCPLCVCVCLSRKRCNTCGANKPKNTIKVKRNKQVRGLFAPRAFFGFP